MSDVYYLRVYWEQRPTGSKNDIAIYKIHEYNDELKYRRITNSGDECISLNIDYSFYPGVFSDAKTIEVLTTEDLILELL